MLMLATFHPSWCHNVLAHFGLNLLSVRIILSLFVSRRPHPLPSLFVAMSSQHEDEFDELAANGFLLHVDIQDFMTRSSEGAILADGHGKITAINKPRFDMCGYMVDEVNGKACAILQGKDTDMEAIGVFDQQIQNRLFSHQFECFL